MDCEIQIYTEQNGDSPFCSWIESLDAIIRHRVKARIDRIESGNFGDAKSLGDRLYEFKMNFGAGYRIYYAIIGKKVIFLSAGDKKTQKKDIKEARKNLIDYLKRSD